MASSLRYDITHASHGSLAQQFVDTCLRSRSLIHALDDHGAREAGSRQSVRHRPPRDRSRNHHRIGWHLTLEDVAGFPVDDFGGGAEKDAHRKNRTLAQNNALGNFGPRPDEAVILNNDWASLQRLQHATNAGAAGNVTVLSDLCTRADRRPGIDHGAL